MLTITSASSLFGLFLVYFFYFCKKNNKPRITRGALCASEINQNIFKNSALSRKIVLDQELLVFLKEKIAKYFPKGSITVYLFGSRARGDFTEKSDYDFAFDFSPECNSQKGLFLSEFSEDAPTLHLMDLIDISQISADFKEKIIKEGQKIYERKA